MWRKVRPKSMETNQNSTPIFLWLYALSSSFLRTENALASLTRIQRPDSNPGPLHQSNLVPSELLIRAHQTNACYFNATQPPTSPSETNSEYYRHLF